MLPHRRRTGRKAGGVSCFRFQNECNKVEIALRVVQFWSEIKLVTTNRTPASRSCDFVITRLISDQIALHSVQLPLLIVTSKTKDFEVTMILLRLKTTFENRFLFSNNGLQFDFKNGG